MKAVAAARQWWAARQRRRVSVTPFVVLAVTVIGCAAIGLALTQSSDRRFTAERHQALQQALAELRVEVDDIVQFGDLQVQLLARRSGLRELRFDLAPALEAGRELQSLHDGRGRIVGWFSWAPDRALIRAMDWLWGLAAAAGVALLVCAAVARRANTWLRTLLSTSLETVRKLTSEDALTGLANQRAMMEALERALGQRGKGCVVLALIDPDRFREVNETVGRSGGDAVLLAIAERLTAALPPGATLGRFEDDAFVVIQSGADAATAAKLGATLHTAFAEPFAVGQGWQISAGIGLAQAPADGTRGEDLLRRAAMTLRAAKRDGRGSVRRFERAIEIENSDYRFLQRELKTAIARQDFEMHYQPIVAADGSGIVGVEALLRWMHTSRGAIAPATFIPVAERNGMMGKLGEFALRRALRDAVRWPNLFVAVNVSPLQIRDPHFVELVRVAIAESGIAAARVVLEMTEGVVIHDPDETLRRLDVLRGLGVGLALDDFGTGYSSLSYLQKFPFQRLKIDRAFVASLGAVGNAGAIIQSIVTLGRALGMSVLAEGVETDEQRVLLRLAGCDELQGFLFARPAPAASLDALLARAAGGGSFRAAAAR